MARIARTLLLITVVLGFLAWGVMRHNPDSMLRAIHAVVTAHHYFTVVDDKQIAEHPAAPQGGIEGVPYPSSALLAIDFMIRNSAKAGDSEPLDSIAEQRKKAEGAAVLLEDAEVPHDRFTPITIPSSQQYAEWVVWKGVDNSTRAPTVMYMHGGGRTSGSARYYTGISGEREHYRRFSIE